MEEQSYVWDKKQKEYVRAEERQSPKYYVQIPWDWYEISVGLPGKASVVGAVLWYITARRKKRTIELGNTLLNDLCVNRHQKYEALRQLREVGLIEVEFRRSKSPIVTLLKGEP